MSQEDNIGSRKAAREQASLFNRYMDDSEDSGAFRVEVGADGRGTDVELELPDPDADPDAEDAADRITAPYDPSKIEIQTSNPTINLLMSRLSNGMIDLTPDFQRRAGIWSDEQQSRLIESLLLRIPIPSFYAAELEDSDWSQDSSWAIVDGIQRLTAIARFIAPDALAEVAGINAGALRLRGLEYLKDDFEGKGYDDLSGRLQIRLNETQVVMHVIRPGTPEAVKFNIFARLNTGGLPLTRQEIRHALIPGPARDLLSALTVGPFQLATGGGVPSARMADREMVLRALAFRLAPPDSFKAQDFDQFLAHTMRQINRMPDEEWGVHFGDFLRAMTTAHEVFGEHAFRKLYPGQKRRSPVNKAIFESVTVNLAELTDAERSALVASREEVIAGFQMLMLDRDFERAVSVGTGDRAKVVTRFAKVRDLFRTILDNHGGSTK